MHHQCGRLTMRYFRILAVLAPVLLWSAVAVPAQWIPLDGVHGPQSIQTEVRSQGPDRIIIDITVTGIWVEDVSTKEGNFVRLQVSDGGIAGDIGYPQIPAVRELIAVPDGGAISWEVLEQQEVTLTIPELSTTPLFPRQPPVEKRPGAMERTPFAWDRDFYSRDQWLPESAVEVGDRGYLRAYSFVPVEVYPVAVNPQSSEVTVIHRMTLLLQVHGADMAATRDRILRYGTLENRSAAHRVLTMPPSLESLDELPAVPMGFLIICDPLFETSDDLDDYVEWKMQKGYQVTVATTDETGTGREQIKDYIQNAYDQWEVPPVHVLLIGDTGDIPYYVGSTQSNPSTDLYFACLEGTDYFADVGLGRLSVITPIQLGYIIQKILSFERVEWSGNDDWETHASFMASTDNWQITEGTHNYVISTYLDPAGYTSDRFYTFTYNANIGQVITALNDGRSLLIYSGHGYVTGWADGPAMNQAQVRELYNAVFPFLSF